MNLVFYYLLAGHLLGDFVFQTDYIANKKNVEKRWVVIHTLIVTVSMLVFSLPFGVRITSLVLLAGVSHGLIDYKKPKSILTTPLRQLIYFLVDQTAHIGIIFIISLLMNEVKIILNQEQIILLIAVLYTIYFASILIQFLLKVFIDSDRKVFYYPLEKVSGYLFRLSMFFLLLINIDYHWMLLSLTIIVSFYLIIWQKKLKWMSSKYFFIKLCLDIFFAISGYILYLTMNS